jgi:proteasome accessory factor A
VISAKHRDLVVPIAIGADVEIGNFLTGGVTPRGESSGEAARMLLREIPGVPSLRRESMNEDLRQYNPQDEGRRFLINGGCAYIDMDHLEICLPLCRDALTFVACWNAAMRMVEGARQAAMEKLATDGRQLVVLLNSCDARGNSYGSHLNFLVPRHSCWEDIFFLKAAYLPFLASFQVSSIPITGAGKVGAHNGRPHCNYQISSRADFCDLLTGPGTMAPCRPIVNSRDEAHADANQFARLHVIFYESNLMPVQCFLKAGMFQLILAMVSRGRVDHRLVLDDPVLALYQISRDPDLATPVRMITGQRLTTLELQERFLEEATSFVEAGCADGIVPDARNIVRSWSETLEQLQKRDWQKLARRLDWVLKRTLIEQAMTENSRLDWSSPEVAHLDHLYASSDRTNGLFWAMEQAGLVDSIVTEDQIALRMVEPPEDTRAWTRGKLLDRFGPRITQVNWDRVMLADKQGCLSKEYCLTMPEPLAFTKAETEGLFASGLDLEELLKELAALYPAHCRSSHVGNSGFSKHHFIEKE